MKSEKGAATQPGIDKVKDLSPSSAWWQHAVASALERQGAEAQGTSRFSIVMWEAWGQFRLLVESLWMGQNCCAGQTTCTSKILIRFLNFSCFYFTPRVIFLIDFWNLSNFFFVHSIMYYSLLICIGENCAILVCKKNNSPLQHFPSLPWVFM